MGPERGAALDALLDRLPAASVSGDANAAGYLHRNRFTRGTSGRALRRVARRSHGRSPFRCASGCRRRGRRRRRSAGRCRCAAFGCGRARTECEASALASLGGILRRPLAGARRHRHHGDQRQNDDVTHGRCDPQRGVYSVRRHRYGRRRVPLARLGAASHDAVAAGAARAVGAHAGGRGARRCRGSQFARFDARAGGGR